MKKLILISAVLAYGLTACKKKDDPSPSSNSTTNTAPSVSITSPENNSSSYAASITISVSASDADGSVAKVEFYDGTTKLGEDASSPFSFDADLTVGSHSLTAKAYDDKGATTTSASVNYSVMQIMIPPPVAMRTLIIK